MYILGLALCNIYPSQFSDLEMPSVSYDVQHKLSPLTQTSIYFTIGLRCLHDVDRGDVYLQTIASTAFEAISIPKVQRVRSKPGPNFLRK